MEKCKSSRKATYLRIRVNTNLYEKNYHYYHIVNSSVIRHPNLKTGVTRNQSTTNFPKKKIISYSCSCAY